jgi:hypothetical protein
VFVKTKRSTLWLFLVAGFNTSPAMAQTAAENGEAEPVTAVIATPTIDSLRFVGHNRVLDTTSSLANGWITLGDDGLLVRWSASGVPQAWNRIDDARHLVRAAGQLAVLTDGALVPLDESTLQGGEPDAHDNFVVCAHDDRFWRWSTGNALYRYSGTSTPAVLHPAFDPAPEALCVVAGDKSMLVWLDGDELRVMTDDGVANAWPWSYATPSLVTVEGEPVAVSTDDNGERILVRLTDGQASTPGATETRSGCFAWAETGGSDCGPETPEQWITDAQLPQVVVPVRSVVSGESWIAAWSGGWFVVRPDATSVAVHSVGTDSMVGVVGGLSPRILVCRQRGENVELAALSPHDGAEVTTVSLSSCPVQPWFGDDAFMGATPEGTVLFQADTFSPGTVDNAVSASAPWGRNQITFVLGRVFDPSCPAQTAWTLERRAAEGEPEPVLGAQCATEAELRPLLDESGQIAGSVVMLREPRRWRSRGFALAGTALFDLTYRTDRPGELRWVYGADGTVEVDDFEQMTTGVASDDTWLRVPLHVHRGSTPITLGTESLRLERPEGSVQCGGSGAGWWCFDAQAFWVSESLARQVVLVMSDGRVLGAQHPEFVERQRNTPFASIADR